MKLLPHVALHFCQDIHSWMWDDPNVIAEEKLDGWRIQVDGCKCYSRSGNELNLSSFVAMPDGTTVDGELIVCRDLPLLGGNHEVARWYAKNQENLEVVLFDILQDGGVDVRRLPLSERKKRLAGIGGERISVHSWVIERKHEFYQRVLDQGGEGVVLKHLCQPYEPGRAWVKMRPDECVYERKA